MSVDSKLSSASSSSPTLSEASYFSASPTVDTHDSKTAGGSEVQKPAMKREQKRRPKPKDGTAMFCGVCGDRALGYNFDAITCESCKAFFRRNALKMKPFSCSFDGSCKLDPHTRKFCSGCRLKKCFSIGMKKEWILSNEQLMKRRNRRLSRQHCDYPEHSSYPSCTSTSSDPPSIDDLVEVSSSQFCHDEFDGVSSATSPSKPHTPQMMSSSPPSSTTAVSPTQFPSTSSTNFSHPYSGVSDLSDLKPTHLHQDGPLLHGPDPSSYYSSYLSSCQPFNTQPRDDLAECIIKEEPEDDDKYPIPLKPEISKGLQTLQKTYVDIFEAVYMPNQALKVMGQPKSAHDLYNMTDTFIRRLIRFAKHIPEFKSLEQEDQICLLKGGIMELFVLRSIMSFDAAKDGWKFKMLQTDGESNSSTGISQSVPQVKESQVDSSVMNTLGTSIFIEHIRFVRTMQALTNNDRITLMLLFVIVLMTSDRPGLSNCSLVAAGQERYSLWLKSYLESKHSVAEAQQLYPKLLMKLLDVRTLGEEGTTMAALLDFSKLEPLLVEIFSFNR